MKVVGFNGSPRKDGNTPVLIRRVFHEMENEGIETEFVQLSHRSISPFGEGRTGPEDETIESCTVLTTDANEIMEPIHGRIPLIFHPGDHDLWLDPEVTDSDMVQPLLRPYPSEKMIVQPVNPKVNNTSYDAPDCVEVVSEDQT